jgi:hypothetical protein
MKLIELQQKCLGGLGGNLNHFFANGVRITEKQLHAIKNEAIQNGKYLNSWESNQNGVVVLGLYVKVPENFQY